MEKRYINEPAKQIPVLFECDVIVVGGGTAGIIAAIAAARQGVKTVLIEKFGALGGLLTLGMNSKPSGTLIGGIPRECWEKAQKIGLASKNIVLTLQDRGRNESLEVSGHSDPEGMKIFIAQLCVDSGVQILFETLAVAPVMEDRVIKGVITESKSGRQAVLAKVVIDCSADGDIAVNAGAPFALGKDGAMSPTSMFFRMNRVDVPKLARWAAEHPEIVVDRYINESDLNYGLWLTGFIKMLQDFQQEKNVTLQRERVTLKTCNGGDTEVYCNTNRARNVSGVDVIQISDAILELYRQIELNVQFLKEKIPGFENAYINGIAPFLGVRETRHILGGHVLTEDEVLNGKGRFKDSIGVDTSCIDFHPVESQFSRVESRPPYEIPYGAIVPQDVEQLLVAGRIVSSTHEASGRTRTIPACMLTGQAAGFAAALAVKSATTIRNIDINTLQQMLRDVNMPVFVEELEH